MYTDFRLNNPEVDEFDGKFWIYSTDKPEKKYEVVSLLDVFGEDVDNLEEAAGGVFKINDHSFMVFKI